MAAEFFDLVVTDLCLPGLSGLDLIRSARRLGSQTRTILLTAYSNPQVQAEAQRLNAQFMAKPFQVDQFVCAAQQALCLQGCG